MLKLFLDPAALTLSRLRRRAGARGQGGALVGVCEGGVSQFQGSAW